MVVVKVHRGKNGRAMIDYPLKDKEYNDENNPRVRMVTGVNVRSVKTVKQEMADVWKYYKKDNGNYIQAQHIIQSFTNDEADPNNEMDVLCAHTMGRELALRLYPDQQAIVVTHADNTDNGTKKAMVHNHIIVNNINSATGKSLRGENVGFHRNVAKMNDKIAKDFGFREAINQIPSWENAKNRKKRKRNKSDELIEGIKAVLDKKQVTTMDEYVGALGEFGISVKHKGSKGRDLKNITYNKGETMTQNPRDSRGLRASHLTKLNGDVDMFSRDVLMKMFEENEQEQERKEKIRIEREQQEQLERNKRNAERMNAEQVAKEILNTMLAKAKKLKASDVEQKPVVEAITTKPVAKKLVDEVVKKKSIIEPIKTKPVAKKSVNEVVEQKPVVPVVEVDEETKARNARIAELERKLEEKERQRQERIKKRQEERAARSKTRSKEKNNDGLSK